MKVQSCGQWYVDNTPNVEVDIPPTPRPVNAADLCSCGCDESYALLIFMSVQTATMYVSIGIAMPTLEPKNPPRGIYTTETKPTVHAVIVKADVAMAKNQKQKSKESRVAGEGRVRDKGLETLLMHAIV